MNWIKENPFVAALVGVTVVISAALVFFGMKGGSRLENAQLEFEDAYQGVVQSENSKLYPTAENRDAKSKALKDYRESVIQLAASFDAFRPGDLSNISPQVFTDKLKLASDEVVNAFSDANTQLPAGFLMGFEVYANNLAQSNATGLLNYQLGAMKDILLQLAEARPTELRKLFRPRFPEETGGKFEAKPNQVARYFPMEITFKASEPAARKFISSLAETDPHFIVVRALRIFNERSTPPKVSDAKFEAQAAAATPAADAFNPFGGAFGEGFDIVDDAAEDDEEAAPAPAVEVPEAAPRTDDSSRILAQVLGSEEVLVFVRLDVAKFLPSKALPQP